MSDQRCIVVSGRPSASSRPHQSAVGRRLLSVTLRRLLEQEMNAGNTIPEVRIDDRGKPFVDPPGIEISITHCPTRVMVAAMLCAPGPIGLDVEEVRPLDVSSLRRKVLGVLDDPIGESADFLRSWVRKEALSKATGDGLSADFSEIGVAGGPVIGPAIPYGGRLLHAHVADLDVGSGYRAALAVLGGDTPPVVQMMEVSLITGTARPMRETNRPAHP